MAAEKAAPLTPAQQDLVAALKALGIGEHHRRTATYPAVCWDFEHAQAPSTEYLTRDSYLQINIYPAGSNFQVTLSAKILTPEQRITTNEWQFTPFSLNALNQYVQALTEGYLLSLTASVYNSGTLVRRGQCFVQAGVQFGPAVGTAFYRVLVSDYISTTYSACWPDSNLRTNLDPPGNLTTASVSNPAAGADWTLTLVAGIRYWIHSVTATLTTAAAAGNRSPLLTIKDAAGNVLWSVAPITVQAASLVYIYNWAECVTMAADNAGNKVTPLPTECLISGAGSISTTTTNIQAADQWSLIRVQEEQWFEL
jgi:hypothetical protein